MVRITKISAGILLLILSIVLMIKAGFEGFIAALVGTGAIGGAAGILMAITYIISAAIYILTNRTYSIVPDIVGFVILILGGLMGLFNANMPGAGFLKIWAWVGIIIGAIDLIVVIVDMIIHPVSDEEPEDEPDNNQNQFDNQNQNFGQFYNQNQPNGQFNQPNNFNQANYGYNPYQNNNQNQ